MVELIAHRKNTSEALRSTPRKYGIELDVRSYGNDLIIHHDPFSAGERFVEWLDHYKHGTLILNVKEEGLESKLLELMSERNIAQFFFLDQSFPFLMKIAKYGESRCAVRLSEFESVETVLSVKGLVDWVWVDCFTRFPLDRIKADLLHSNGFKLCLVSPELQGRVADQEIPKLGEILGEYDITPAAICTKRPDLWEQISFT